MPLHLSVESEAVSTFEALINLLCTPITLSMFLPGVYKKKGFRPKAPSTVQPDVYKSGAVALEGEIKQGIVSKYSINGVDFSVTANTCVVGELAVGATARVKVVMIAGRQPFAKSVVVLENASYH